MKRQKITFNENISDPFCTSDVLVTYYEYMRDKISENIKNYNSDVEAEKFDTKYTIYTPNVVSGEDNE